MSDSVTLLLAIFCLPFVAFVVVFFTCFLLYWYVYFWLMFFSFFGSKWAKENMDFLEACVLKKLK